MSPPEDKRRERTELDARLQRFLDEEEDTRAGLRAMLEVFQKADRERARSIFEAEQLGKRMLQGLQELTHKVEVRIAALENRTTGVEARVTLLEAKPARSVRPPALEAARPDPAQLAREFGVAEIPTGKFKKADVDSMLEAMASRLAEMNLEQEELRQARDEEVARRREADIRTDERTKLLRERDEETKKLRKVVKYGVGIAVALWPVALWLLHQATH